MSNIKNNLEKEHQKYLKEEETIRAIISKHQEDLQKISAKFGYHKVGRGWGDRESETRIEIKQARIIGELVGDIYIPIDVTAKTFRIKCGYISGRYYQCAVAIADFLSKAFPEWQIEIV